MNKSKKTKNIGKVLEHDGLEVKTGNSKIGNDTIIFNMGTSTDCPSRALGLCKVPDKCYAFKAERMYPPCKPYRSRQAEYWLNSDIDKITHGIDTLFEKHTHIMSRIKYFRFNESGDFYGRPCVFKLYSIATHLKREHDITTYGYTARHDLRASVNNLDKKWILIKGSGYADLGNNGYTSVIESHQVNQWASLGKSFKLCPGDCRTCKLCKVKRPYNIAFVVH